MTGVTSFGPGPRHWSHPDAAADDSDHWPHVGVAHAFPARFHAFRSHRLSHRLAPACDWRRACLRPRLVESGRRRSVVRPATRRLL